MLSEAYCERISDDWMWREKDLRAMDSLLLRSPHDVSLKSAILIVYSHWEGHFKFCASQLLEYIAEGVRRKIFRWTDISAHVRQRMLFCGYRKSSLSGQAQETFISYLNALHDDRYAKVLGAKEEIVMVDDNLNTSRAEAICRNLGVDYSWFIMKKIIIDERLLEYRNTIAHGANRLRSGDDLNLTDDDLVGSLNEVRALIRETKNRFANAISEQSFLGNPPAKAM